MANGRKGHRNQVTVRGQWLPFPVNFLRSRVCAELSHPALRLLVDLLSQLGFNAKGNGDLGASMTVMEVRGWTSKSALAGAVKELQAVGLLVVTRQGGRRRCSLYALTLWPVHCDPDKLDYGAVGSYGTDDWKADPERAEAPSIERPAVRRHVNEKHFASPSGRGKASSSAPSGGVKGLPKVSDCPSPRGVKRVLGTSAAPLRGDLSRSHLRVAGSAGTDGSSPARVESAQLKCAKRGILQG